MPWAAACKAGLYTAYGIPLSYIRADPAILAPYLVTALLSGAGLLLLYAMFDMLEKMEIFPVLKWSFLFGTLVNLLVVLIFLILQKLQVPLAEWAKGIKIGANVYFGYWEAHVFFIFCFESFSPGGSKACLGP